MRLTSTALLLATAMLTPALAADISATSRIDAVTVFPHGAEVTRVAQAKLEAGEHALILDDLPGELDPQSIRVEGASEGKVEIGSVDSKIVAVPTAALDAERERVEAEVEALGDERSGLDQTIADAESQKRLLLSLADRQLAPASKEDTARRVDAAELGGLFDLIGARLAEISKTVHAAQIRQRAIDKAVNALQARLAGLAPARQARMRVSIHLATPAATSGLFKVKYRVLNAGWLPFYDARLATPDKDAKARVELVRRAEVNQATGESWTDVALSLSTARPLGATAAPDLEEEEVAVYVPGDEKKAAGKTRDALKMAEPAPMAEADAVRRKDAASPEESLNKVEQAQAAIETVGFQALYAISGRVTVDNSGTAKKVRIATDAVDATLNAVTSPKLDARAYLTATFVMAGDTPLLPGQAMLYRDGVFMGQGSLPLLNPGAEAKLGFGADDLVEVERKEVKRELGEEGLLTTSHVEERRWDITVKNLHAVAMPITVIDGMPFSTHEQVTVEPASRMTPPAEANLDKRRGVHAWRFELEPAEQKTIGFGYKITWPKDFEVGLN